MNLSTIKKGKCSQSFLSISMEYVSVSVICFFIWYHPHSLYFCTGYLNQHVLKTLLLLFNYIPVVALNTKNIIHHTTKACLNLLLVQNESYITNLLGMWYFSLILTLSMDVHPNPGQNQTNKSAYKDGFLSFCNWNFDTLSKDNFYRVTLLEAHT